MTASLRYRLEGYDFVRATGTVRNRLLPVWIRLAMPVYVLIVLFAFFSDPLARRFGFALPDWALFALFMAGLIGVAVAVFRKHRLLRRAYVHSPLRSGEHLLSLQDDGLRVQNPNTDILVRWPAMTGAIAGRDGLMVLLGKSEFLPVPAAAFADTAARDAMIATLNQRISQTRSQP